MICDEDVYELLDIVRARSRIAETLGE